LPVQYRTILLIDSIRLNLGAATQRLDPEFGLLRCGISVQSPLLALALPKAAEKRG
jgi:hypothetical protein